MDGFSSARPLPPRSAVALLIGACLLLTLANGWIVWQASFVADGARVFTLFDDSLISMRYAEHLARGWGLRWNPQDARPVEGYSNLLWVLWMALVQLFVKSRLLAPAVIALSGIALVNAVIWQTYRLAQQQLQSDSRALIAALLVAAYFPLSYWTVRGMEVGLCALLLLCALRAAILLKSRPSRSAAAALALALGALVLTRDENLILLPAFLVYFAAGGRPAGLRLIGIALLVPLALKAAHVGWRLHYYGDIFPNTYYLKISGNALADRLQTGLGDSLICLIALAPLILLMLHGALAGGTLLLPGVWALFFAYQIYIGGDAWILDYSNRFLATTFPILAVGAALGLRTLGAPASGGRWLPAAFALCAVLPLLAPQVVPAWVANRSDLLIIAVYLLLAAMFATAGLRKAAASGSGLAGIVCVSLLIYIAAGPAWLKTAANCGMAPWVGDDIAFAQLGLFLDRVLPADARIAATYLGAPSYYSGRYSIDLYGKVDPVVARLPGGRPFRAGHNKKDLAYSIGRLRPDVVLTDDPSVGDFGYRRLGNGIHVRLDWQANLAAIGGRWCQPADISPYCPDVHRSDP